MAVERSPLLPHQLQALRDALHQEMDDNLLWCATAAEKARELRRRAEKARFVARWWLFWRADVHDGDSRHFGRRAIEIRKALKSGDEVSVGHRSARRLLHRQEGGR